MAWHTSTDLDEFDAATGGHLIADRARNTLLLTLVPVLRRRGLDAYGPERPVFGWHRGPDGAVDAAFLQTPPRPLVLTAVPEAAVGSLVGVLAEVAGPGLAGVNAPNATAEAVAAAWHERTGASVSVFQRHRLYRLQTLVAPNPLPPGAPRIADAGDRELLIGWYQGFAEDAGGMAGMAPADVERIVDDRIGFGGLTLWETDGRPVAMAGAVRPVAGTVRVAPVYTPRDLRGRGYAGAATYEVSRRARFDDHAEEVLLFTDLANPTSNALYQRLGYREVEDRLILSFTAAGRG